MSISFGGAVVLANEYRKQTQANWLSSDIIEKPSFWFFPIGYIGSAGLIIDKADGRLWPMGSALGSEDMFWGHEHGFSAEFVDLVIEDVYDSENTMQMLKKLAHMPDLAASLGRLPLRIKGLKLWLKIPLFKTATEQHWFGFSLVPTESQATLEQIVDQTTIP